MNSGTPCPPSGIATVGESKKAWVISVFLSQQALSHLFSLHFRETSFVWAQVKNA